MAESVDALVSNTSGATHPGSIPGLGTKREVRKNFSFFIYMSKHHRLYIRNSPYLYIIKSILYPPKNVKTSITAC